MVTLQPKIFLSGVKKLIKHANVKGCDFQPGINNSVKIFDKMCDGLCCCPSFVYSILVLFGFVLEGERVW